MREYIDNGKLQCEDNGFWICADRATERPRCAERDVLRVAVVRGARGAERRALPAEAGRHVVHRHHPIHDAQQSTTLQRDLREEIV